jgi:hypothetical protein
MHNQSYETKGNVKSSTLLQNIVDYSTLLQNIVDYILQYIFIIIICESQKVSEIDL